LEKQFIHNKTGLPSFSFGKPLSLQVIFGYLLSPIAWLLGIPRNESLDAGNLATYMTAAVISLII